MPRITVDTSVVIAAADKPQSAAARLFQRALKGEFDVAASSRLGYQLTKPISDSRLASFVSALPVLPTPGRYDGPSTYNGSDVWAGAPDPRPHVSMGSKLDDDHLEAHRLSGRDTFVTLDDGQLRRARTLGMSAATPEQLLGEVTP